MTEPGACQRCDITWPRALDCTFCPECGRRLRKRCYACDGWVYFNDRVCSGCGTAVASMGEAPL